jgi:hypothetical protein
MTTWHSGIAVWKDSILVDQNLQERLAAIFLMLREELSDSDIPCCTTIRHRIEEVFEEHLCELEREMKVGFPLKFFKRFLCS